MRTSALLLAILALIVVEPCSAQPPPPPPGGGSTGGGFNGPGGGGTSGGGSGSGGGWVSSASVVGGSAVRNSQPGTKGGENCDGSDQVPSSPVTRSNNLPGIPREETQICIHVHDNEPQPPGTDCGGCCGDGGAAAPGGGVSPAVLRDTGGGGGGCASCGGGGPSSNATSGNFTTYSSGRGFYPEGRGVYTSFGPGQTSDYDSKIFLYPDGAGGTDASFYNAVSGRVYSLVDGLDGDTADGEFHDLVTKSVKSFTISDGSGNPVSDVTLATTGVINYHSGVKQNFDVLALTDGSGNPEYVARLAGSTDRNGRTLTIAYRDSLAAGSGGFTAQELTDAPDRHLQIHQVTDWKGDVATYHYKSTQESGRWVVEKIDLPDGDDIDYAYTDGNLTSITIQDGTVTSFAYGQDTESQAATVEITTSGANNGITIHLTNDYMTLDQSGQAAVINQPQGIFRLVNNAAGETQYMLVPDTNVANQYTVYKGSGQASEVIFGQLERHWEDGWQAVENSSLGGGSPVLGAPMTATVTMTGTQELAYAGAGSSTTVDDLYAGTIPELTDATGREYSYQYDTDGFLTKKTFVADGTYEEYAYNTFKQVTRVRDRQGNVTLTEYDANGNRTKLKVGLKEVGGQDVAQPEYAEQSWDYYPVGHYAAGLLKTAYSPEWDGSSADTHRTDYEYDARGNITKVLSSASSAGGTRPETNYTYNPDDSVASTTDSEGHTVTPLVDGKGRTVRTTYDDGSTEETLYGADGSGDEYKILKTKNRRNVVTSYSYDISGRTTQVIVGTAWDADILDGQADDTPITDRNEQSITNYTYLDGTEDPITVVRDGSRTDLMYDYRGRVIETKVYPYANKILSSKVVYVDNNKFSNEDAYGRKKYYGYRASDGQLIRYVTGAYPSFSLADQDAVFNLVRDTNLNPDYTIKDAIADENGRPSVVIDERGIQSITEYNSAGQVIRKTKAVGTAVEAITEMDYDDAGDVVEIRSPRYFDANDANGFQKCKTVMTYDGGGRVRTRTEAPGTPEAGTESYTYDALGRQVTRTDARGKIWTTTYASCCGHSVASINPLGHGSVTNQDNGGLVVHNAGIADVATHTSLLDPDNTKTLQETTTRYDALGRSIAKCIWLVPQGLIDVSSPPMAGFDGISGDDGLTTQTLYDADLTDGIGLDSSAGVTVTNPLGGTFTVSLSSALTKMAEPTTQGGAGLTFDANSPGSAVVSLNAENEVSFQVSDCSNRQIMSGILHPHDAQNGATPGDLITWSCQVQDTLETVNSDMVLTSINVDALGYTNKARTNGLGHTLQTVDQAGFVSTVQYDACGNAIVDRDPNAIGFDYGFDDLNRRTSQTDMLGNQSQLVLDKSGQHVTSIDAKGSTTDFVYNARGNQITEVNRLGHGTYFTFDAAGHLLTVTDAESQTTIHAYDDAGNMVAEESPDHVAGSVLGDPGYGAVSFTFDELGRRKVTEDQQGNRTTVNLNMAGRIVNVAYTGHVAGPHAGQTELDTFTYDRQGRLITGTRQSNASTIAVLRDDTGSPIMEELSIDGLVWRTNAAYDNRGTIGQLIYDNGELSETLVDSRGNTIEVNYTDSTPIDIAMINYDASSRIVSQTIGNTVSHITYDGAGLVDTMSVGAATFKSQYDTNRALVGQAITGPAAAMSWAAALDLEARPLGLTYGDGTSLSFQRNAVGNVTSLDRSGNASNWQYGDASEILEITSASTAEVYPATYAANGKMTGLGDFEYSWHIDGRLASVTENGRQSSFEYDALGRLIKRTELDSGASSVKYGIHFSDLVVTLHEAGLTTNRVFDHDGVLLASVSSNGEIQYCSVHRSDQATAVIESSGSERYLARHDGMVKSIDGNGGISSFDFDADSRVSPMPLGTRVLGDELSRFVTPLRSLVGGSKDEVGDYPPPWYPGNPLNHDECRKMFDVLKGQLQYWRSIGNHHSADFVRDFLRLGGFSGQRKERNQLCKAFSGNALFQEGFASNAGPDRCPNTLMSYRIPDSGSGPGNPAYIGELLPILSLVWDYRDRLFDDLNDIEYAVGGHQVSYKDVLLIIGPKQPDCCCELSVAGTVKVWDSFHFNPEFPRGLDPAYAAGTYLQKHCGFKPIKWEANCALSWSSRHCPR